MTGGYLPVLADTLTHGPWVAAAASRAITPTAPARWALAGVLEGRPQPQPLAVLFTNPRARAAQLARDAP
jgi:hypothetical protein